MKKANDYSLRKKLGVLTSVILLGLLLGLGFRWYIGLVIFMIEAVLLMGLGEKLVATYETDKEQAGYIFPLFEVINIVLITSMLFLFSIGDYKQKISYFYWLMHRLHQKSFILEYELVTHLLAYYIGIVLIGYGKQILEMMASKIQSWFPPYWAIIMAGGFMIFTREGFNQFARLSSLLVCMLALILTLLTKRAKDKQEHITYVINSKLYFLSFLLVSLFLWSITNLMPTLQELPGTRWLNNIRTNWGQDKSLVTEIPYASELNKDVSLSEAILFEIEASEPVYLRDMAYKHYENNTWSIENSGAYLTYLNFEPIYLEAEYTQTTSLLNQIAWIRSERPELFKAYGKLLSYENTTSMKKQLKVSQNPINKINYFTVNSFKTIEDKEVEKLYYYGSLENLFFHSEKLIEPTEYKMTYYNRVPRIGSREYAFLRSMNHEEFLELYTRLQGYKKKGIYNEALITDILKVYNPLIQYNKAKNDYLQIPSDLKQEVKALTKEIVKDAHSDWEQAEVVCNYLKEHYEYSLETKPIGQKDDIEDFLFVQKKGLCQDFASSMVLMCRSLGIPARYVTGYLVSEKKPNATNTYIVREKDAHAFVEVYLPAYGWMQFDPTPKSSRVVTQETNSIQAETDYTKLGVVGILIIGMILSLKKGKYYIEELYWYMRLKRKNSASAIESLMKRTLSLLAKEGYAKREQETISQYASRMKNNDKDIVLIVNYFEKYTFGGVMPTHEEIKGAIKAYSHLKKVRKA